MTDALVYAVMKNIISDDPNKRSAWESKRWNQYETDLNVNYPDIKTTIEDYLDKTTIRRACCMARPSDKAGFYHVPVRIPTPTNYPGSPIGNKYGYADIGIDVPKSLCESEYVRNSPTCNKFMEVYCDQIIADFNKINNITQDDIDKGNFPYSKGI